MNNFLKILTKVNKKIKKTALSYFFQKNINIKVGSVYEKCL